VNTLVSYVYGRRRELAALKAVGVSTRTLVAVTVVQALLLGLAGGAVGTALTLVSVPLLNTITAAVVGFGDVVSFRADVLVAGVGLGLVMSVFAGAAASLRIGRLDPLEQLR
jgi:ABC-type antimicrobial peptide transport system permease subunit